MRKLLTLLVQTMALCSAMVTPNLISITADGSAHQLAASGTASWIQFIAPSGNASTVYIGGSAVNSTVGLPLVPGSGMLLPALAADPRDNQLDRRYALAAWYYVVQSGDKLSITYVP
jgi:hypothetical protein